MDRYYTSKVCKTIRFNFKFYVPCLILVYIAFFLLLAFLGYGGLFWRNRPLLLILSIIATLVLILLPMGGDVVITTNFGALPETCAEWPVYVNYTKNLELLAVSIAGAIDVCAGYLHTDVIQNHLEDQQKYYKNFYSWDKKAMEWENFLKGALRVRQ